MQEALTSDSKIIKTNEDNYEVLEEEQEDEQKMDATDVEYTEAEDEEEKGKDPYEGTPFEENKK
jgi:recombination protein RecT